MRKNCLKSVGKHIQVKKSISQRNSSNSSNIDENSGHFYWNGHVDISNKIGRREPDE